MSRIHEHVPFDGKSWVVTFVIDIEDKEKVRKSKEFAALERFVLKLDGHDREEMDKPVTREDLNRYAEWDDVYRQFIAIGSRIGRRDKLLAAVAGVAVIALVIAIRALM